MTHGRFVAPDTVVTHFHLRKGDRVGDFGAGTGAFVVPLSRQVGSDGRVYALEIRRSLTDAVADLARRERAGNVEVVWCDLEKVGGTKLRENSLDAAVMVNTLFLFEQKDAAIDEVFRTVRSGGKFFLIDWSESWGGMGPHPTQVVKADDAKALVESHRFVFERSFDAGDHHYGLSFRKP
jgi:ubiquinone/menaquinone biosynthesis C-methylase UbiE